MPRIAARLLSLAFALSLPLGLPAGPARADPPRADQLPLVPPEVPGEIVPLRGPDGRAWPEPIAEHLAARIREQWGPEQEHSYGVIESRVGLALDYPLVNSRRDGAVLVPVLEGASLPVSGRVVIPSGGRARRLVLLVDVSESAGQRTPVRRPGGAVERIRVRDGALQTAILLARRLLEQRRQYAHLLDYRSTDLGVIAFGDTAWPLVEPGTEPADALAALEKFAQDGVPPEGRSDAVCALNRAVDWLEAPEGPGRSDVVLLTHGDLPFSNRFTNCRRIADHRERQKCLAALNRAGCPGWRALDPEAGHSDIAQLFALARESRQRLRIFPVLFQRTRPPRFMHEIASHSGGELIRVGEERGIETAVEQLLLDDAPRVGVDSVAVRNLQSRGSVRAAVEAGDASFACEIGLVDGPNEIEVDVRSGARIVGRYRFRVERARDPLGDFLSELKDTNRRFHVRAEDMARRLQEEMLEVREQRQDPARHLAIDIDGAVPGLTPEVESAPDVAAPGGAGP